MSIFAKCAPVEEIQSRIEKLQQAMQKSGVQGALIVQNTDLFYFAATSQQGWLYVPDQGQPLLMVYKEFSRAREESPLEQVISQVSPKKIPQALSDHGYRLPKVLGLEFDVLPTSLYFQYAAIFPGVELVDLSLDIRMIRAIKSSYEIDLIQQAAICADRVSAKVPELIEPGKTEVMLAGELEAYARSLGHQGTVRMRLFGSELFYGHLLSGPDAATPSYLASPTGGKGVSTMTGQGAGFNKLQENQPILVDYVFALNGYLADHARIFSIGKLPQELIDAHQAMLEIQGQIMGEAVPGVLTGDLYEQMIRLAASKGYEQYFMGAGERRIRFTGHGIGLELDEFPFIAKGQKLTLAEGMIIALEPKVIWPGKGVVGIENSHLVTADGLKPLTRIKDDIVVL